MAADQKSLVLFIESLINPIDVLTSLMVTTVLGFNFTKKAILKLCICACKHDTYTATVRSDSKWVCKRFMHEKFNSLYSLQLIEGKLSHNINVSLKLSLLKPIHAERILELYDKMTTIPRREIIHSS